MRNENNAGVDLDNPSDEEIVSALHSCGIDTRPSKYGFSELQVDGTNVPNIRNVYQKLIARRACASQISKDAGVGKDEVARLERMVDAFLAHCPDPECLTCGEIVCAYNEPLHFHHDGCPSCDALAMSAGAAAKIEKAPLAEQVRCNECAGTGGYSRQGDCTDCNGKGYNWEPIEPASAAGAGSEQQGDAAMAAAFGAWCPYKGSPDPWMVWQDAWRAALARAPLPEQDDDARDAARYRWLRSQDTSLETQQRDKGIVNGPSCYHEVEGIRELKWGAELDTAIDAAMSASRLDDKS